MTNVELAASTGHDTYKLWGPSFSLNNLQGGALTALATSWEAYQIKKIRVYWMPMGATQTNPSDFSPMSTTNDMAQTVCFTCIDKNTSGIVTISRIENSEDCIVSSMGRGMRLLRSFTPGFHMTTIGTESRWTMPQDTWYNLTDSALTPATFDGLKAVFKNYGGLNEHTVDNIQQIKIMIELDLKLRGRKL